SMSMLLRLHRSLAWNAAQAIEVEGQIHHCSAAPFDCPASATITVHEAFLVITWHYDFDSAEDGHLLTQRGGVRIFKALRSGRVRRIELEGAKCQALREATALLQNLADNCKQPYSPAALLGRAQQILHSHRHM